jgi:hypothetical protein
MLTSISLGIVAIALTVAAPPLSGPPASAHAAAQQQATASPPPAQTPEAPPAQGRGAGREGPQRPAAADLAKLQTVEDLLEGMEISNADKFLQVDNQHYGEFIQRLRNLQRMRRQHQNQRQRLVMELRRLTNQNNPPVEDALLEAPTKRLDDFDKQAFQDMQNAYAQIDEVLNVRQRARFRLFEEMMEQRKLEILTRVLKSGQPAAPGRGGK